MARCNVVEFHGYQCPRQTYLKGTTCIWHKVLHEFREDVQRMGPWAGQFELWGAGLNFAVGLMAIHLFSQSLDILWLLSILVAFGSGLKFFADGTMAIDGPISNFVFWAKTLAVGLVVELIGDSALAYYVVTNPGGAVPLIRLFTQHEWWLAHSHLILALVLCAEIHFSIYLLTKRVLFRQLPMQDFLVLGLNGTILGSLARPYLERFIPFYGAAAKPEFWASILGPSSLISMGIAWVIAFILCELMNAPMRSARLTESEFKNTITNSFPVCTLPPLLGIFGSRYLLPVLGLQGAVPFIISACLIAIVLCWIGTNWLIKREIDKRPSRLPW